MAYEKVKCPTCGGLRYIMTSIGPRPCPKCHGKGYIYVQVDDPEPETYSSSESYTPSSYYPEPDYDTYTPSSSSDESHPKDSTSTSTWDQFWKGLAASFFIALLIGMAAESGSAVVQIVLGIIALGIFIYHFTEILTAIGVLLIIALVGYLLFGNQ